jgi:hypothetical protein
MPAELGIIDPQDKTPTGFSASYFSKAHLHHFSKIKRHKEVTKQ